MEHVFQCQTGNSCYRCHHLQMAFVEMLLRASSVEVNRTHNCARNKERYTEHRTNTQFRKSSDATEGSIVRDITDNQTDALAPNAFHQGTANADRVSRSTSSIPCDLRSEIFRTAEEEYRATLGRDYVEN